ncbi:glycosyltransferase [Persicitalea jodogahamensis]|uniref:Putative glycosyltransferase WbbK n=1 Tax=Persicitalea jodogahamensis TaxID=402147 RepID=A0A8J3D2L7_9BACT|nr:glycosyltransferase [Persicitalea jodogahamensis]GHB59268.1 putative glycosyltransferase WbbK [Persicitalea jodogahamensis]
MYSKPVIVVSAINIFEGGPLTILKECLNTLNSSFSEDYKILLLAHNRQLFSRNEFNNIQILEFPKSRKSWLFRIYYEYFYFNRFAKIEKVSFWLSLHDTSPTLPQSVKQFVYCHNPGIFYKATLSDLVYDKTLVLFSLFYKYLYRINIKRNSLVIVQQDWIRQIFHSTYNIPLTRILVAYPHSYNFDKSFISSRFIQQKENKTIFIYAAFPRIFKNFEIIVRACKVLVERGIYDFEVKLTLSGYENLYSKKIKKLSEGIEQIKFLGLLQKNELEIEYSKSDVLIFPSKLETWGLPISEFKRLDKTILLSQLPYANETLGNFDKAHFFDPDDHNELVSLMESIIKYGANSVWDISQINPPAPPFSNSWKEMFRLILKN